MEARSRARSVTYRVAERDHGARLDLFLKERIPRMSREGIKSAIRTRVAVGGRRAVRPATILRCGDEVVVAYPIPEAGAGGDPGLQAIAILREDPDILAVDKPAGVLVHATASSRGAALLSLLKAAGRDPIHLVHRLDRETSGVVLLARSLDAARALSRAFASGEAGKTYLAVVFGEVALSEGTIDLALGKAAGSAVHVKQGVVASGRSARTDYRVVERLDGFTLVELRPHTGRRHQIRVHMQAIGHPVVGDKLYAAGESHHLRFRATGFDERMRRELLAERHLLHAASLTVPHPRDGRRVTIEAPLPADMAAFLAGHRGRAV